MPITTTTDYTDRLVDLEAFQTASVIGSLVPLSTTLRKNGESRKITGLQKLVQRYLIFFLTTLGDVKYDKEQGTEFIRTVINGGVQTRSDVIKLFAYTNSAVQSMLDKEDSNDQPDDERFHSARLKDYNLDFANGRLYLSVEVTSLAGDSYAFVIPT